MNKAINLVSRSKCNCNLEPSNRFCTHIFNLDQSIMPNNRINIVISEMIHVYLCKHGCGKSAKTNDLVFVWWHDISNFKSKAKGLKSFNDFRCDQYWHLSFMIEVWVCRLPLSRCRHKLSIREWFILNS